MPWRPRARRQSTESFDNLPRSISGPLAPSLASVYSDASTRRLLTTRPDASTTAHLGAFTEKSPHVLGTAEIVAKERRKRRKRGCCCKCCIIMSIVIGILVLAIAIFIAVAEFTSSPGYNKSSQDTASQSTGVRIQDSRSATPSYISRLMSSRGNVSAAGAPSRAELVTMLQRATAFSSAAYTASEESDNACPQPVGARLVRVLDRTVSGGGAAGFVATDDDAKQIIVAFRGAFTFADIKRHLDTAHVPLNLSDGTSTGTLTSGRGNVKPEVAVQRGFLQATQLRAQEVAEIVRGEVSRQRDYSVLVTGHGLGGCVAVMTGLLLREHVLSLRTPLLVVTQGQPRTGNAAFADYVDRVLVGPNATNTALFRVVHHLDGLPALSPEIGAPFTNPSGRHHGGEVWQIDHGASPENVVFCDPLRQEDPVCSVSRPARLAALSPTIHLFITAEHFHALDIELASSKSRQCGKRGGHGLPVIFTSRGLLPPPPKPPA
ncbi:hypothetical protein PYCC9005_002282 [Savitreella phatthalungensis]